MIEFDHKGPDIISECRNGCSIGSPAAGIKDVVGSIVAFLDVRSEFGHRDFFRERTCLVACDVPCAIRKIDSAGGQNSVGLSAARRT
jgi:hypothetical protein